MRLRQRASAFSARAAHNRLPNVERNAFRLPYVFNVDLRISRRFRLTETANLEVFAEGFNIFNRVNITDVGGTAYTISTRAEQQIDL